MYQHENIVIVGIDGSPESHVALRWACHVAINRRASIRAVAAYSDETLREDAQTLLDEAIETVRDLDVKLSTQTVQGDAVQVLLEQSKVGARIIVGQKGVDTPKAGQLGPVAHAVTSKAFCPVAVVPMDYSNKIPIKHIVVGVDGSDESKYALNLAVRIAGRWGGKVSAINAVNVGMSAGLLPSAQMTQEILEDTRIGLEDTVKEVLRGDETVSVSCYAVEGSASDIMADFSTTVDLVIVGTRGRGGLTGFLFGSTSQQILKETHAPVIVVPPRATTTLHVKDSNVPWDIKDDPSAR